MTDAQKALDELPVLSITWPCLGCGAKGAAGGYNINDSGQVMDCANCAALIKGEHLEGEFCWCEPELTYDDGRGEGGRVYTHRERQ